MTLANANAEPKVTAELIAEAAAWLAILHGPNRTSSTERGFSQWMKRSASHARAFEEATEIWEESRHLPRPGVSREGLRQRLRPRRRLRNHVALAATVACFGVGVTFYIRNLGIGTNIGEQRMLALEDGSSVILNTDTRVVVFYSREARRIELKAGEALFEVAKETGRPFLVTAGTRKIQALGTSFVVRRDESQMSVTLIEGKVAVSDPGPTPSRSRAPNDGEGSAQAPNAQAPNAQAPNGMRNGTSARRERDDTRMARQEIILIPGERVTFSEQTPSIDHPALEKLLAWQRREVAFDNTTLHAAISEMNRYSRKPLQLATSAIENVRVTGLFRTGDSMSFARAVAEAYQLSVSEQDGKIVLSGAPAAQFISQL